MNDLVRIDIMNLTMSSREIAEMAGRDHRHVMRDIRIMLVNLGKPATEYAQMWTDHQNKQEYQEYRLPKRESLILVSGYDVVMRTKIIDRWMELEESAKPAPVADLSDPVQLRGILLGYTEKVIALENKVAEQTRITAKGLAKLATVFSGEPKPRQKIGIVGLKHTQASLAVAEFKNADFVIWDYDSSQSELSAMNHCDVVFVHVDHCAHTTQYKLDAIKANTVKVHGGITSLRDAVARHLAE